MAIDTSSAPLFSLAEAICAMRHAAGSGDTSPQAMLGDAFCHQACGRCPPEGHLGDAETRELHKLADSQMGSKRPQTRDAICVT
jgi:hypothetical protein